MHLRHDGDQIDMVTLVKDALAVSVTPQKHLKCFEALLQLRRFQNPVSTTFAILPRCAICTEGGAPWAVQLDFSQALHHGLEWLIHADYGNQGKSTRPYSTWCTFLL